MKKPLTGRCAFISGAAKRLGRAFAVSLANAGADLALHYHTSANAIADVQEVVRKHGVRVAAAQADFSDSKQPPIVFRQLLDQLGEIDILINNASLFDKGGILRTDLETWQRNMDVNLTAAFLLTQEFAKHRGKKSGVIINLLDWRALRPGVDHLPYTIAKAGLAAMTRSNAQALGPNIRVNGLALGAILPPVGEEQDWEFLQAQIPMQRWGTIEEVVAGLHFLLRGCDYLTGEILHIDGGRHLVM